MENFVFYRGPSELDGSPIIGVAIVKSRNIKTGDMVQTWILPDGGMLPTDAMRDGADAGCCGDCPLRGEFDGDGNRIKGSRICYVHPQGINTTYAHNAHRDVVTPEEYADKIRTIGKPIRLGAFGEPPAIPFDVWEPMLYMLQDTGLGWTGYTHQWRRSEFECWQDYLMASIQDVDEILENHPTPNRWRWFRANTDGPVKGSEILCPNTANKDVKCTDCLLCVGNSKTAKSIYNPIH